VIKILTDTEPKTVVLGSVYFYDRMHLCKIQQIRITLLGHYHVLEPHFVDSVNIVEDSCILKLSVDCLSLLEGLSDINFGKLELSFTSGICYTYLFSYF